MTSEERRASIIDRIPGSYRPAIHFGVPGLFGVAVLVACIAGLRAPTLVELAAIPVTLFGGFAFEWRVHRDVLHRETWPMGLLYRRHELAHHVVYTYDDMQMRSWRELGLILMPVPAIFIVFGMTVALALGVGALLGVNVALLFVATAMVFFLSYEWLHAAYHLSDSSFVGRLGFVRRLRELHRRHHDPRLMKKWNFNVTVPVFDWLRGTLWSPERAAARDEARERRRAGAHAG